MQVHLQLLVLSEVMPPERVVTSEALLRCPNQVETVQLIHQGVFGNENIF